MLPYFNFFSCRVMAAELGPQQVLFMSCFQPRLNCSSMLEVLLFGKWYAWKSDCLHFAIYLFALLTQIRTNAVNPTVTLTPMGAEFWGSDKAKADKMKSRIPLGKFAGTNSTRFLGWIIIYQNALKLMNVSNSFSSGRCGERHPIFAEWQSRHD